MVLSHKYRDVGTLHFSVSYGMGEWVMGNLLCFRTMIKLEHCLMPKVAVKVNRRVARIQDSLALKKAPELIAN